MDISEVEQSAQRCHGHIHLRMSHLGDAHIEDIAPYLGSVLVCVTQFPRRQIGTLSSLLKKVCRENHSEQLIGKESMATAFLNHVSGLNKISAAAAYQKEFKSHSSLPICLKVNAVDGIRLPWHKTLLYYFAVTWFCTKMLWILFSQEQPVAAGISKALGCFPAQMACSSAALQLPQSRQQ